MKLIVRVSSNRPDRPLSRLLTSPLGLDVWEAKPEHLVLRAAEASVNRLKQMGYQVESVATVEEHLNTHLQTFAAEAEDTSAGKPKYQYHSAQSLEDDLRHLAESRHDIAELHEIGRSVEKRPIWALRIGSRENNPNKKRILFMGCHHAREWIAVEVPFLLASELVNNADKEDISGWLSTGEIWVAPMVNPDGHEFTRTQDRLWRKNRRPNSDGSVGVDPNRNYGYMWGSLDVPTSSHVPSDETYIGPYAFSEPETQAIRDLVGCVRFHGVVTYHSFSQLILYPWGFTDQALKPPADQALMSGLAEGMASRIKQVHQKVYTPEQSSQLYPTAGDTTDWTYGTYRIPSFTIELRPTSVEEGGFVLPPSQIEPTWEENRPAAFFLIERIFETQTESLFAGTF